MKQQRKNDRLNRIGLQKTFLFTLLCTCFAQFSHSQENHLEIGVLLGNNGQLDKTLNDFYYWAHETHYLDDSNLGKGTNLKFGVSGRYFFTDHISARLKAGYAIRNGSDSRIYWNQLTDYKLKHNVWSTSPAICFSKQIEQLEMTTGLEVPLFFVSPFSLVITDTHKAQDSITVVSSGISTVTMSKGFVWGINNFIQLKYFVTDALAIGGEIGYGILFAKLGDELKIENESTYPDASSSTDLIEKRYKKNFFSTPEVSLGIFLRLGSGSSCIVPGKNK